MIYRQILETRTVGSRKTKNLHSELGESLPHGFNYRVLEYDEPNNTCILEVWCSDCQIMPPEDRKTRSDLEALTGHRSVIGTLQLHRDSPAKLGTISVSASGVSSVDNQKKEVTVNGRTGKFLRVKNKNEYVVDEG